MEAWRQEALHDDPPRIWRLGGMRAWWLGGLEACRQEALHDDPPPRIWRLGGMARQACNSNRQLQ